MKPLGIDDEQDGCIAKLGKVTYGLLQAAPHELGGSEAWGAREARRAREGLEPSRT